MTFRTLKYLAAGSLLVSFAAHAQDYTPDATRILSDPTYLPLQGQIFGSSEYQWESTTQDVFNSAGALTESQRIVSNPLTQLAEYGVTDDLALRFQMGYDPSARTTTNPVGGASFSNTNQGWTDPNFGVTYRVLDERDNPVSFDLRGSYSPDAFTAISATDTEDGTVALGGQYADFGASLGHETRSFTIAGNFDAEYYGHRNVENLTTDANVDTGSLWAYQLGLATQTRLTDQFSFNAGVAHTLGYDANVFNEATTVAHTSHVGGVTNLNAALNYHFIPNTVVGSLEYQHNFSGGQNNIYAATPASDTEIHDRSQNILGVQLRYVMP
jgi:hypothetical protein